MKACGRCGKTIWSGELCKECSDFGEMKGMGKGVGVLFLFLLGLGPCVLAYQGVLPWWGWVVGLGSLSLLGKAMKS
jgi:hypothetical protein